MDVVIACLGNRRTGGSIGSKGYLVQNQKDGTIIYWLLRQRKGQERNSLWPEPDYLTAWILYTHGIRQTTNEVQPTCSVAIMGANFEFSGRSAHAGACPHLGREVLWMQPELMSVGVNYLREHMIDRARIHYAYVDAGGTNLNVVQDHSLVKYESSCAEGFPDGRNCLNEWLMWQEVQLMTGTTMKYEITMAFSDYVPNDTLGKIAAGV